MKVKTTTVFMFTLYILQALANVMNINVNDEKNIEN